MNKRHVLLVDAEAKNLEMLQACFMTDHTFTPHPYNTGEAAWEALEQKHSDFHLILLDGAMPDMNVLDLLKRIKANRHLCDIPVIIQTPSTDPDQIRAGLEAGAYYYLTKPFLPKKLLAIAHGALADALVRTNLSRQLHHHINATQFLTHAEFTVKTIDEAMQLASFLAHVCPNPDSAILGISELLINGIEHGNLGMTYEEKAELKRSERWHDEIARRASLPENRGKKVTLKFYRTTEQIELHVSDQGMGFAWERFLEIDPARAFDPNGRGIALARMMSFDRLYYEGCGNIAVATITCCRESGTSRT